MSFEFRPAVRQGTKPLIGIYGESGTGKTMSALLLARGLVGPTGTISLIDTESGRGSMYADVIPGGFNVAEIDAPFTPDRYTEALIEAEKNADCVIVDSASHEWEGIGGVLDMAAAIEKSSGKPGLHCWNKPKAQHKKFMLRVLQSTTPVIFCLRAKYKSRQTKDRNNKTQIIKDDFPTPIQDGSFIYEMTAHIEIHQDHTIRLSKCSHPDLRGCFPEDDRAPISVETGELIAKWAAGSKKGGSKTVELQNEARNWARKGRDELNAWWKTLSQPDRKIVHPIMDSLKDLANQHDNPPINDDIFASEARQDAEPSQGTDTPADMPARHGDPQDADDGWDQQAFADAIEFAGTVEDVDARMTQNKAHIDALPDEQRIAMEAVANRRRSELR